MFQSLRRQLKRIPKLGSRIFHLPAWSRPSARHRKASGPTRDVGQNISSKMSSEQPSNSGIEASQALAHSWPPFSEPSREQEEVDEAGLVPNAAIVLQHPSHSPRSNGDPGPHLGVYTQDASTVAREVGPECAVADAFGHRFDDLPLPPAPVFVADLARDWARTSWTGGTGISVARTVSLPPSILPSSRASITQSDVTNDQPSPVSGLNSECPECSNKCAVYTTPLELHFMMEEMGRSLRTTCGCANK
ncbi:uncharacterized protein EI90DRAFT_3285051 [Cantharellus anzutake]|uniref:uncharacterized protein n=1 Tax=Cantharellus anzutake TaxID=1750568 RepID=UPI001906FCDC|nr:uncharacterized protein EI90DRAFT_3285051 [Cantharellus anzutake]KAF8343012.1 hypothetical protein EI90DRAFT_3285051 [Cantharellus anzutake]